MQLWRSVRWEAKHGLSMEDQGVHHTQLEHALTNDALEDLQPQYLNVCHHARS